MNKETAKFQKPATFSKKYEIFKPKYKKMLIYNKSLD